MWKYTFNINKRNSLTERDSFLRMKFIDTIYLSLQSDRTIEFYNLIC